MEILFLKIQISSCKSGTLVTDQIEWKFRGFPLYFYAGWYFLWDKGLNIFLIETHLAYHVQQQGGIFITTLGVLNILVTSTVEQEEEGSIFFSFSST
jgi:hypothetical protein